MTKLQRMKIIFLIHSCNLSNIDMLIKYTFAHLVLLNCKFRHTKMLFSDHQNSVKSSPRSRKCHFRDSQFKNFLWPLTLEALLGMSQLCSATLEQLFSARATSSNYTLSNEKWYMTPSFSLFGAK